MSNKLSWHTYSSSIAMTRSTVSLRKTVANNHAKGNAEAYPSSCHAALTMMNNFEPLVIEGAAPVAAQGTAFAQKQKQKVAGTPATECNYNKEYCANKECQNCSKKGHLERCCTNKKGKAKKDSEDDKSVLSSKSIKSLTKLIKTLKKLVSVLQAHQENSNNVSSLSSEDGDAHFQYACVAIEATNPCWGLYASHESQVAMYNQQVAMYNRQVAMYE
jgi:hypothetical protein